MPSLGGGELILIAVVVLIVFGAGRLPDVLGQLGKGVRDFRAASEGKDSPTAPDPGAAAALTTKTGPLCTSCGKAVGRDARFCPHCGMALPA